MLWSAVSIVLCASGVSQQMPKPDLAVWESAKKSVAVILRAGVAVGPAVLIDKNGLFLANQSTVSTPNVQARLSDGKVVTLDWKSTDVPTQTVLLQAEDWSPTDGSVVSLRPPGLSPAKTPVIVVLPDGPVRGDLTAGNRVAVLSSSHRMFPLGEVRFEASNQSVAGALVFDESGYLVGLLNATLETAVDQRVKLAHVEGPKSGAVPPVTSFASQNKEQSYGPADFTTGYTLSPDVLRRVVTGFLSPTHKVLHPAIGINCKDGPTPGALVLIVKADSPAAKAGIEPGDVIVKMDEIQIQNQFDFARVIESKDVGDPLKIVILRDGTVHSFEITVGTIQRSLVVPSTSLADLGHQHLAP